MTERSTKELIEILGDDIDRCHDSILTAIDNGKADKEGNVSADYECHARNLIRTILAFIEAVTFSVKIKSLETCLEKGIKISDHERYLGAEIDSKINEKGEIVERTAKISLARNVRFAFRLLEKASAKPSSFDPESEWWSCFKSTIRVRDRLTHPRMPEDVDITGDEIISALKAKNGFVDVLLVEGETIKA